MVLLELHFFDEEAIGFEIEKIGGTPPPPPINTPYPIFDDVLFGGGVITKVMVNSSGNADCNHLRASNLFTIVNDDGSTIVYGTSK